MSSRCLPGINGSSLCELFIWTYLYTYVCFVYIIKRINNECHIMDLIVYLSQVFGPAYVLEANTLSIDESFILLRFGLCIINSKL